MKRRGHLLCSCPVSVHPATQSVTAEATRCPTEGTPSSSGWNSKRESPLAVDACVFSFTALGGGGCYPWYRLLSSEQTLAWTQDQNKGLQKPLERCSNPLFWPVVPAFSERARGEFTAGPKHNLVSIHREEPGGWRIHAAACGSIFPSTGGGRQR